MSSRARRADMNDLPGLEGLWPSGFGRSMPQKTYSQTADRARVGSGRYYQQACPGDDGFRDITLQPGTVTTTTTTARQAQGARQLARRETMREASLRLPTTGTQVIRPIAKVNSRRGLPRVQEEDPPIQAAPFPSGFPVKPEEAQRVIVPERGIGPRTRQYRAYHRDFQDPDMDHAPFPCGFPGAAQRTLTVATPARTASGQLPPDRVVEKIARMEAEEELRTHPVVLSDDDEAPLKTGATQDVVVQWEKARKTIAEAEQEAGRMEQLVLAASDQMRRSNLARQEAEAARQREIEARERAAHLPEQARNELAVKREALREAKGSMEEVQRDVHLAELDLDKAHRDVQSKVNEHKVVGRAAKAKRDEVEDLERRLSRIEMLRNDADAAEARAVAVEREVQELLAAQDMRRRALDDRARALNQARVRIEELAQEYSRAIANWEMATEKVRREMKEAEFLHAASDAKTQEAFQYARQWRDTKRAVEESRQRQDRMWQQTQAMGAVRPPIKGDDLRPPAVAMQEEGEEPGTPMTQQTTTGPATPEQGAQLRVREPL